MLVPCESLEKDSKGVSSRNFDNVLSMLPDAYCVNFPCELKITRAISQSNRMLRQRKSMAKWGDRQREQD
jgi:hypothetical protein